MGDPSVHYLELTVDGCPSPYLKAGSGPPLVLLHGGASDSRDWLGVMAEMSPFYTCYAPDLPGFGRRDGRKSGYYLSEFIDFIRGFIRELSLEAPVLVGHSLSGRLSLEIARCYPEEVSKIVVVDSSGFGRASRLGSSMIAVIWALRKLAMLPQPYPDFLLRDGEDPHFIYLDQLPAIAAPTFIVWKRYDLYFPLSQAVEASRRLPRASLAVIPGYGHAPHKQDTSAFCRHLKAFLNRG